MVLHCSALDLCLRLSGLLTCLIFWQILTILKDTNVCKEEKGVEKGYLLPLEMLCFIFFFFII